MADDAMIEGAAGDAGPGPQRYLIVLEAVVCFAAPCVLLFGGLMYLPIMIAAIVGGASGNPLPWSVVATLVLGWIGIAGIVRLLWVICARRPPPLRRALTLAALACGVADVALWWFILAVRTSGDWGWLIGVVVLPLACTLHLTYLARRRLFA